MEVLSFCIRLILLFAACSSSSILLCALMKQSLWLFVVCFTFACLSLFCFCFGLSICLPSIGSFGILSECDCSNGGGVRMVRCICGVFLRSGCTGLPGQHIFHSSSSLVIGVRHESLVNEHLVRVDLYEY
jgi:hypothetical protein